MILCRCGKPSRTRQTYNDGSTEPVCLDFPGCIRALEFYLDNHVIVDDTQGASDQNYRAKTEEPVGFGGGDTPRGAILSLCESLREAADEIEKQLFRREA